MTSLHIHGIRAGQDNYIWTVSWQRHTIAIDPGEAPPVIDYLARHHMSLAGILITHHHADHTAGIVTLANQYPGIPVHGPDHPAIAGVTHPVRHAGPLALPEFPYPIEVWLTPGHTASHVSYLLPQQQALFCGDTLFGLGCGRIFDGTAAQLHASLNHIALLPPSTRIYCAHEYTALNLAFARKVDPLNPVLQARAKHVLQAHHDHQPTVPLELAEELATNPFLRCHLPELQAAAHTPHGSTLDCFTALREMRNRFQTQADH